MMAEEKTRGGPRTRNARRRAGNKLSSVLKNEDATQRKAALETAIRKKIACEQKALQVVERLLEEGVTEDVLLDCGKLIIPAHYKDVVEERSIIKLCGYPICQNRLQNVSKQKYKISTKTNKVYDITERKCFCSNFCYRASKYFESQVAQSPVWLREEERPPDIELLQQGARGHSGKEVKLVDEGIKPLDVEHPAPTVILSDPGTDGESSSDAEQEFVSSVLQENLSNAGKHVSLAPKKSKLKTKRAEKVQSTPITKEEAVNSTAKQLSRCHLENPAPKDEPVVPDDCEIERTLSSRQSLISESVQTSEGLGGDSGNPQLVFLGVSQKGAEHLKRLLAKSKHPVKHVSKGQVDPLAAKGNLLAHLRQTFTEWRTEETLRLLYDSGFSDTSVQQQTPSASCEKEELDVDDLDNAELLNATAFEKDSLDCLDLPLPFRDSGSADRSLPSYEQLKEETSQMEVKVMEFYQGKCTIAEDDLSTQSEKEQQYSKTEDQQWVPIFPLVDFNAQQQIRIRIILEKLQKALPVVLGPLQIPLGDVYSEIKNLVKTFRLTNTNIIHKTPVWTLITIVLLSVLSEHIPVFANCQQSQGYTQFLATLLEELHFQHKDFESLTRIFRRDCLLYCPLPYRMEQLPTHVLCLHSAGFDTGKGVAESIRKWPTGVYQVKEEKTD